MAFWSHLTEDQRQNITSEMWNIWVRGSFSKTNTLTNSIDFIPNEHLEQKHWTKHRGEGTKEKEREREYQIISSSRTQWIHMKYIEDEILSYSITHYVSLRWLEWDVYPIDHGDLQVLLKRTSAWLSYPFWSMTNVYGMELIQWKTFL